MVLSLQSLMHATPSSGSSPVAGPLLQSVTLQSVNITSNTVLSGDVFAQNITIESGVTVYSEGHDFFAGGYFHNYGTIVTGWAPYGDYVNSYGGSGGGALSPYNYSTAGFSTIAPGGSASYSNTVSAENGQSSLLPALNNSLLENWCDHGMNEFLCGAAGGSGPLTTGGGGANGIYIQANSVVAGVIRASGSAGNFFSQFSSSGYGTSTGGGGGGCIVIAYGNGGLSNGSYSYSGGNGAYNQNTNPGQLGFYDTNAGNGGNGQFAAFYYGNTPPVSIQNFSFGYYSSLPVYAFSGASVYYGITILHNSVRVGTGKLVFTLQNISTSLNQLHFNYNMESGSNGISGGTYGPKTTSMYGVNPLPMLNQVQLAYLSQGRVPSDSIFTNGTVLENTPIISSGGQSYTYEIVTPGGYYWYSEDNGVLVAAELTIGGYVYVYSLQNTNIPGGGALGSGSLIGVTSAAVLLAVLIPVLLSRKTGRGKEGVRYDSAGIVNYKKELLGALNRNGSITDREFREVSNRIEEGKK